MKEEKLLFLVVAVLLLLNSCQKNSDEKSYPNVQTTAVENITNMTALGGGKVVNSGSFVIISKGVCWSLNQYPTIDGNKSETNSDEESYTCKISGLQPRANYHLRAYAVFSDKVVYGDEITFTTLDNDLLPVQVEPMLGYNWTVFTWPYNAFYPAYNGTNAVHSKYPAPCGPTTLARVLAYWKGRIKGSGFIDARTSAGDARFTVNLDTISIDYSNLPASLSSNASYSQYKNVAKIFLVAGSVGLTNFIDVGTPGDDIINGFKRYFNVSDNVRFIRRWDYSRSEWIKLLKTELAAGRPLMIAARTASSPIPGQPGSVAGHWFNIEGYNSDDKFYINYNYQGTGFKGYYDIDSFGEYCKYGLVVAGFEPRE
jgi:hypothetical protein